MGTLVRGRPLAGALAASVALAPALAPAAGCDGGGPVLRPIIDAPDPDSDAYPYSGLTSLVLSVTRAGEEVSVEIPAGERLELIGVDYGSDVIIHLTGLAGEVETAYGRTCATDVTPDTLARDREIHLYMSRIVKWGAEPAPIRRLDAEVQAYALPDGRAAFVGGWPSPMAARFDPQEGSFADLELPSPLEPRRGVVLAPLADGRALLIGGMAGEGDGVPLVEVIDPRPPDLGLGPAGPIESHPGPRLRAHAAATLVDGSVVVMGGEEQAEAGADFSAASPTGWQFVFGEGGVLEAPRRLGVAAAHARAGHTMTRLGDEVGADVLIVGGRDETGAPVAQAELYRPLRQAFELVDGALLAVPRWGHTAVRLPGGSVLIIGGVTRIGDQDVPVSTLELYDPVQGRFATAGELPTPAGLTGMSASSLPDGRVLLAGGRDAGGQPVATAFIARLDSLNGAVNVSPTDPLAVPRTGHGAVRLCDGTILVVGGTDDPDAPGGERYNPPSTNRR